MTQTPEHLPNLANADWLHSPALQNILSILGGREQVRVVGGAVRNWLLGEFPTDFDLATVHSPDEVCRRALQAGIKSVPTGYEHGTVSLVVETIEGKLVYEVTTLREDTETDGRHAIVSLTQSWELDAQRRDFTINALYCDEAGQLYDFVGGLEDVSTKTVRFIGAANKRIEEDYLRILRFFRFSATFGEGVLDAGGMAACVDHKTGLVQLSAERIKQELFKLFVAPKAAEVIEKMIDSRIFGEVLPGDLKLPIFARLADIELTQNLRPSALLRLAALAEGDVLILSDWSERLKLSNMEGRMLSVIGNQVHAFSSSLVSLEQKSLLYRLGKEVFVQCVLLGWSFQKTNVDILYWRGLLEFADNWKIPEFPITGSDVLVLEISSGPQVGILLAQLENEWISDEFETDVADLKERLKILIQSH